MPKLPVVRYAFLLLLLACPAQGAITFGVVEGNDGLIRSEDQAHRFAAYLSGQLHEEVAVQTFANEKTLHAWLNRYHMVDMALFSDRYLSRQPPGEFFRLAGYVTPGTPQTLAPEFFIARQGLNPWILKKLQRGLLAMGHGPQGQAALANLGMLATVPAEILPEELANLFPPSTTKEEPIKPAPAAAAPAAKPAAQAVAQTQEPPKIAEQTVTPSPKISTVTPAPTPPEPATIAPPKSEPSVAAAPFADPALLQPETAAGKPTVSVTSVIVSPPPKATTGPAESTADTSPAPLPQVAVLQPPPPTPSKTQDKKPAEPQTVTVASPPVAAPRPVPTKPAEPKPVEPKPVENKPTDTVVAPPPAPPQPEPVATEILQPEPVAAVETKVKETKPPLTGEALREVPPSKQTPVLKSSGEQPSFHVEQVGQGIFAALVRPGGHATSNAFFLVGPEYVIAGGAHMAKQTIDDLLTAIRSVTDKPLRYFILTHHHVGYNYIDFDFPPGVDLIISWQTWKAMDDEIREMTRPILFFSDGLTLKLGEQTVVLTNIGPAHTDGDTLVFLPDPGVVFTSDLVYLNSVGYMGDGHMEDWLLALEFVERLGAKKLIPGVGPVGDTEQIVKFKNFFRDLVSEVLKHIEQGDSLDQTLRTFSLPGYEQLAGYRQFLPVNIRRIYTDLKENFTK